MIFPRLKIPWQVIAKVFSSSGVITLFIALISSIYLLGNIRGYQIGRKDTEGQFENLFSRLSMYTPMPAETEITPTLQPVTPTPKKVVSVVADWGGPELWQAVNKKRTEFGVNPLEQRDELCTIASIRLNEQLELGTLDNHEGFTNLKERRSDLAWIFEKYSTLAEFLAQGGKSAADTVSLWENTLGHRKLLTGGEYVWGCIYAQETFAVAITAF